MADRLANRYAQIIEHIFLRHYREGAHEVEFSRDELTTVAAELGIKPPKNLGDIIYSFRYRVMLPHSVVSKAPEGQQWTIESVDRSNYRFAARREINIVPTKMLGETKIPDSTPGVVAKYALTDEQALLARVRYNRLVDIFTGSACYSLQNHLRTSVPGIGQVEIDEVYVGVDRRGAQFVFPVQAKAGKDRLGVVQIEQDAAVCRLKFPDLTCRCIAAQFMESNLIAMLELEEDVNGMSVSSEKHYRLVPPDEVTSADLELYRSRAL